ncbi:hypothetical protein D5086_013098 [Populus alba]|uniref:Uncharacterized protein n=2 Tax=Populus alba TaxID=43335 RepID=A0A4U5QSK4_POPAL|nr:hypothetical protein D5086_0000052640 [Populus alba]
MESFSELLNQEKDAAVSDLVVVDAYNKADVDTHLERNTITAIDQQQRLHGKNVSNAWPLDPNSPSMEAYQFWAQTLMDSHNHSHESASEENQQVMIHQTSITSTDNSQASRRPHHMIADEAYGICKMISDGKTQGIGSGTNLEEFTEEIRNEVKKEVEDWRAIQ